jgi:prophage tail gpP-like protein
VSFALRLGGMLFKDVISASVTRDLEELAGGVECSVVDNARLGAALPAWWRLDSKRGVLRPGERLEVLLDDEVVLTGYSEVIEVGYAGANLDFSLRGRDATGDLVESAAAPFGPSEYRDLKLDELVRRICQPFGIGVRADVDVGRPFERFGIDVAETALSAIEKACRQRAVLAVGDGLGGLVLTRGGTGQAPAPLRFRDNVLSMKASFDHSERHDLYIVKGQSSGGARQPAQHTTASEITPEAPAARRPAPSAPSGNRPQVVMTGQARDAAVTRYRPTVQAARTQSGGASVAEQADWLMRTRRAKSETLQVTVPGWRAGKEQRLWRPNERVTLEDAMTQVTQELLVAGATYRWGEQGASTELRLCGVSAFDLVEEGSTERRARRRPPPAHGTASEVTEAQPPPRPGQAARP